MKLMTKELEKAFAAQGDTSSKKAEDIKVLAKYFNPAGPGYWYCYEYDPKERMFQAYVNLIGPDCAECGPVSLDELSEVRGVFGLKIERDLTWKPRSLKSVMDDVQANKHV